MWHMNGVGWAWWVLMSVGMVAFWAIVIYGLIWIARGQRTPPPDAETEPPMVVLKRRLARGEISVEEYERLREALNADEATTRRGT